MGVWTIAVLTALALIASACAQGSSRTEPSTPAPSPTATVPSVTPSPSAPGPSPVGFESTESPIDAAERASMLRTGVWRAGCPVRFADLRLVTVSFWGFDGGAHTGRLVLNHDAVAAIVGALRAAFDRRFPIRRMVLVDAYGGDDERSMAADNTSAFNCRGVPGSDSWSQHAFGRAIDVNPLENPEVRDGIVDPPAAARYANRSIRAKGMIRSGDALVRAFGSEGWTWGGDWHSLKDYQHFSANGL